MAKTETLNLRVSKEFKQRLEEQARAEMRSVTNYLEATLTRLWREQERGAASESEDATRRHPLR